MGPTNHHCNVLVVASCGLLIEGDSGSGKTSLTLGLLETARNEGLEGFLVGDDQVYLNITDKGLEATVPESISGKLELRGYGVVDWPHQNSARISAVIQLTDDAEVERHPDEKSRVIMGQKLPLIEVPVRHEQAAVRIVFAWLRDNILSPTDGCVRDAQPERKALT